MPRLYISNETMKKIERLYWLMPDNNITDDELVNYLVTRELNAQELAKTHRSGERTCLK